MDDLTPTEVEALTKVMGNMVMSELQQKELAEVQTFSQQSLPKNPLGIEGESGQSDSTITRAQFLQLEQSADASYVPSSGKDMESLSQIKLNIEVVLGSTKMPLKTVLELHSGSVVALDKLAGEPIELVANGTLIAKGELVLVDDNFGIRILEVVNKAQV